MTPEEIYKANFGNSHQAALQAVYDQGLRDGRDSVSGNKTTDAPAPVWNAPGSKQPDPSGQSLQAEKLGDNLPADGTQKAGSGHENQTQSGAAIYDGTGEKQPGGDAPASGQKPAQVPTLEGGQAPR